MEKLAIARALTAGMRKAMDDNEKVVLMGEDIGQLGGVFRVTEGLQKDFGPDRVIDSPLAESGIVGTAIGMSVRGYRPVVEIQFDGFVFPAYDQIVSHLAKMHNRSAGSINVPVVLRIPFGGGLGSPEHHSESPESLFSHVAGLRMISPSNANDAYWMIQQAIDSPDPVIVFEPKRRYWVKSEVDLETPPADMHAARIAKPGEDLTLLAYGPLVQTALEAADAAADDDINIEVVDLRSISPLDMPTITESVQRTGRLVIAHEAPVFSGLGAEIAARVTETCFYHLEAPVTRVGGFHIPYPPSRLEEHHIPDLDRIMDGVDRAMAY